MILIPIDTIYLFSESDKSHIVEDLTEGESFTDISHSLRAKYLPLS